jgi:two-component system phosphate regulon sensor histidine kinase PhoR
LLKQAERFHISGDEFHLKNALSNILDNALKYSDGNPELIVKTFNRNHNLVLEISDNGIGIEKEFQEKVFEKYFRVPSGNVHDVKGFGIGLSYLKAIVKLHQGSLELDSEPGKGSKFIIELPYA